MKKHLSTLLLSALVCTLVHAQRPTGAEGSVAAGVFTVPVLNVSETNFAPTTTDEQTLLEAELAQLSQPGVQLADFRADAAKGQVALSWLLYQNPGDKVFLQRSKDRLKWEETHSFDKASDEGMATFRMSDDWKNEQGTAWYRLRLLSEDGRTFFSPSVAITCFEQGSHTTYLFPHSLIFGAAVALDLREKAPVSIAITNESGEVIRMIYESEAFVGRKMVEVNLDGLAKGNYICRIIAGNSESLRVITR